MRVSPSKVGTCPCPVFRRISRISARITTEVSAYHLALEIQQTHRGMLVALPLSLWERFATLTTKGMAAVLREMAGHVQLERNRKTTRGPKKPPPKRTKYKNGEHVATFRVIAERKKALSWKGWPLTLIPRVAFATPLRCPDNASINE